MKLLFYISSLLFTFTTISLAQEEFDPAGDFAAVMAPKTIRVHVEYYELSTLEYADIMTENHVGTNDTKLRNKLLQMAKDGKAKLVETQTVVARPSERATSESITEYIYPTEYDPPYAEYTKKEKGKADKVTKLGNSAPTATAFETRNLGATLEVEPSLGEDGTTIDMRLKPEIITHAGESVWGESVDGKVKVKMPTFYTYRVDTSVTLMSGVFHFVAALTPMNDKKKADRSKKLLMFVKGEVLVKGR